MNGNISAFCAEEYDEKIRQTLPYYEEFYKQAADVVRVYYPTPRAVSWLDVGCGTGKMAEAAFGKVGIERFVFCDCSAEMIEKAENRFAKLAAGAGEAARNAEFIVSDVRKLAYRDTFDVVTAIQVNHYFQKDERIAAIKKCCDALKENGIYIIFENFAPFTDAGKQLYLDRWKAYQAEQGKSEAECEKHIGRYNKAYFPITVSEHLETLKSCGFRTAEILWLSYMQVGILAIK